MKRRSVFFILTLSVLGVGLWFGRSAFEPEDPGSIDRDPMASEAVPSEPADSPTRPGASNLARTQPSETSDEQVLAVAGFPFEHEFLELEATFESEVQEQADGIFVRRVIGQSPQYPDRIFVEEQFRAGAGGEWERIAQVIEVADEWIIRVEPGDDSAVQTLQNRFGAEVVRAIEPIGLWTFRFPEGTLEGRERLREDLGRVTEVEEVLENGVIWPTRVPNDPGYPGQWELRKTTPELGWDILTDAAINDRVNVVAGVVDTGVNFNNPDITPWVNTREIPNNGIDDDGNGYIDDVNGYDAFTNSGDVHRGSGHGVNVANILGSRGNNGYGKASVAWNVEILAGVSFSRQGAGSTSAAGTAIYYAATQGARVINCSFIGGGASSYTYVINRAAAENALVIAGAGNNGWDLNKNPVFPVNVTSPNVIGVGATTNNDNRAGYSNFGRPHVEVFAPTNGGTSYAAPMVSSLAALLIADDPEAHYSVIYDRIVAGVDQNDNLRNISVSGGRINVTKALRLNTLRRPKDLQAIRLNGTTVRLNWTDQSTAETGFIVERSTKDPATVDNPDDAAQMSWQVIANNIPANRTYYDDTSASGSQPYFYRVRAKGPVRNSARNFVTRVTPKSGAAPATSAPNNPVQTLHANSGGNDVSLTWNDTSNNEAGFVLERSEDGGTTYYILAWLPANTVSYRDTEVSKGASLTYRLKTYTVASGSYSSPVTRVVGEVSNPVNLVAPGSVKVNVQNDSSAKVTWQDRSEGESGYLVERSTNSSGSYTTVAQLGANVQIFTDSGLKAGTTYYYRVSAVHGSQKATSSVVSGKTPMPAAELVAPAITLKAESHAVVTLAWEDRSKGETAYQVERSGSASGPFATVATLDPNAHGYRNTGLSASTTYFFRVAVTDGKSTLRSKVVSVETPAQPAVLVAPKIQVEESGTDELRIRWTDTSQRQKNYFVEYSLKSSGSFTRATSLNAAASDYRLRGLSSGVTYFVRVGVSDGARTIYSAAVSAMTAVPEPDIQIPQPSVQVLADGRVRVTWQDRTEGESGYRVERSTSVDGVFSTVATLPANSESYLDASAQAGRTYWYRVSVLTDASARPGSASYKYFRWIVTGRRGAANSIQVSEFELTSGGNRIAAMSTGKVSNPGGHNPGNEKPANVIDGRVATKWLDYNFDGSTVVKQTTFGESILQLEFPSAVNVDGYTWATANDAPARDPASWRLEASNDGKSWSELDAVTNFRSPAGRRIRAGNWELLSAVSDFTSEAVKAVVEGTGSQASWRKAYFGSEENTGMGADDADPDGDGWANFVEFATLQSPVEGQAYIAKPGRSDDNRLTLEFQRRWNPTFTYVVQSTVDLGQAKWTDLARLPAGENSWSTLQPGVTVKESGSGESRTVTVIEGPEDSGKPRYLRLVIRRH